MQRKRSESFNKTGPKSENSRDQKILKGRWSTIPEFVKNNKRPIQKVAFNEPSSAQATQNGPFSRLQAYCENNTYRFSQALR